ncbi:DUF4350 domain-containing protein [Ketobacter sp.]|uniref:DUF4350 domain-containing protein n=1 Tax=Ketobacter sp. TaxID=2083498 RepID=UPI000F10AD03|nr:DUF4350 domain-containing protein [Ketobacter sp.]RLU01525.1 MAG: hypothetical protein D9N14_01815 [Ketobacter sp.]
MNRRHLLLGTVILALAGAGLYWLSTQVERYTHQWDSGPELNVLFNPWHAAQQFLARQQKESHRSFNLHPVFEQLNPYDALILDNSAPIANPATRETLLDWVNNGGHLVITAVAEWDFDQEAADPLLDEFGVRLYALEEDENEDYAEDEDWTGEDIEAASVEDATTPDEEEDEAEQSCTFFSFDNLFALQWEGETLQIESVWNYTLDDDDGAARYGGDAWPNAVLQYQVGAGRLTVLMDTTIWESDRIGDYDHAYFLWQLVKADDVVWFVSSNDSESLLDKLWRTAPFLMTGLLVLLLIWGWRRWVRFGPMIPEPAGEHRQLLEHIEAATRFDWNHAGAGAMVESLRHDIRAEVSRQHHLDFEADQAKWLELVARSSQLDPNLVVQAMSQPSPEREHPWTELISQLQTIRNAL